MFLYSIAMALLALTSRTKTLIKWTMDMIYFDVCQFSVNKEISRYYLIITPGT